MDLITTWNTRASAISFSALRSRSSFHNPSRQNHNLLFPFWPYPLPRISYKSFTAHAKKRSSQSQPLVKQTIVEQISTSQQQDDLLLDDFEDGNHYPFSSFLFGFLFVVYFLKFFILIFFICLVLGEKKWRWSCFWSIPFVPLLLNGDKCILFDRKYFEFHFFFSS